MKPKLVLVSAFIVFVSVCCKSKHQSDLDQKAAIFFVNDQSDFLKVLAGNSDYNNEGDIRDMLDDFSKMDIVAKPEFNLIVEYVGVSKNSNFRNQGAFVLIYSHEAENYCVRRNFNDPTPSIVTRISSKEVAKIKAGFVRINYR